MGQQQQTFLIIHKPRKQNSLSRKHKKKKSREEKESNTKSVRISFKRKKNFGIQEINSVTPYLTGIVRWYRLAKCPKCSYVRKLKKNSFKGKAFPNVNTLNNVLHTYYQLDIICGKNITVLQYSGDSFLRTDLLYIVRHFFSHS